MTTSEIDAICERLNRVESQNRSFKLISSLLLFTSLAGCLLSRQPGEVFRTPTIEAKRIEAEELLIRDPRGQQARLFVSKNGPRLELTVPDGKVKLALELDEFTGSVVLYDASDGKEVAYLDAGVSETRLGLDDWHRTTGMLLDVNKIGPQLTLWDGRAKTAIGHIALDKERRRVATTPEMMLSELSGMYQTSAASLVMIGRDGRLIFRAP